jgi:tripartite-type tricarboxylate transporter receptor subunit TctC
MKSARILVAAAMAACVSHAAIVSAQTKEVMDAFAAQGAEPFATTPDGFGGLLKRDIEKWAVVVRETGAKVD